MPISMPQPQPQTPAFKPQGMPQAQAPQQQQDAPELHEDAQEIEDRINSAPREVQQFITKFIGSTPQLPTFMGIIKGPEVQDYFAHIQQMIAQQTGQGQPNSPAATQSAPAVQNPQASMQAGGSPAMATSTPQGM